MSSCLELPVARSAIACLLVAAAAQAQTIRVLEPPTGGLIDSVTVSRNGQWIATGSRSSLGPQIHRYGLADLVRENLGTAPGTVFRYMVGKNCIANDGTAIATGVAAGEQSMHARLWRDGTWSTLAHAHGPGQTSRPWQGSSDLRVVAGIGRDNNHVVLADQAWRWTPVLGGLQYIRTGSTSDWDTTAAALSGDGSVMTWRDVSGTNSYIWASGTLLTVSDGLRINAVSADGATVAGMRGSDTIVWDWASGQQRTVLAGNGFVPTHVLAGGDMLLGGNSIWMESTGTVSLTAYLEGHGLDLTGWSPLIAHDASDDGTVFVGRGMRNGEWSYIVVEIPAPGVSGVVLAGAVLVGSRRRRR